MAIRSILITGVTGYIARHIAVQALEAGLVVRGSTRDLSREDSLRDALARALSDPKLLDNFSLVALDNLDDAGWVDAFDGVDALVHTASPVPVRQPQDPDDLIKPARDGALRAVRAAYAAGVRRVVMTSSIAAITTTKLPAGKPAFDEADWTDTTSPGITPYVLSKTHAERAVWDWVASDAPDMAVTMINPAVVIGPPVGRDFGASVYLIKRLMEGRDPVLPRVGYPLVDVRDVAAMHLAALHNDNAVGQRFIASNKFYWHAQIGQQLRADFPDMRPSTREAPDWVFRLIARFIKPLRGLLPMLGVRQQVSGQKAVDVLGITYHDTDQTIRDTGQSLIEGGAFDR